MQNSNNSPDELFRFLKRDNDKILIVSHIYPDGDAIGSLIAFGGILDQIGIPYIMAVDGICPDVYSFLDGFSEIRNLRIEPLTDQFHRIIALDTGTLERIGSARNCIGSDTTILNIDHHFTGGYFGHLNYIQVKAASTTEIIYELSCLWNIELCKRITESLFVGILTDTGRFRFSNSTANALRICADLVETGVNIGWITENIYFNFSAQRIKTLGKALSTLEIHCDGFISMMTLSGDSPVDDTEGFVEYAASIKNVALAVLITEMKSGLWKVSLRSKCPIDVNEIAELFGGGGHRKAAGFRYRGSFDVLKNDLLKELEHRIRLIELTPGDVNSDLTPLNNYDNESIN